MTSKKMLQDLRDQWGLGRDAFLEVKLGGGAGGLSRIRRGK